MKQLFIFIMLFISSVTGFANNTLVDKVELRWTDIFVNGERLRITRQYDGKPMDLYSEHIFELSGKNPGVFLSIYPDAVSHDRDYSEHIIITDATGPKVRQSNVIDTGLDFQWGDNNYVIFENGAMYFGIYSPKRMQFVYRDGKLEINKGPWRGPAKPRIYIEPTGKDPCFNVNSVEDCREEVARRAEKAHAKKRLKAR